jgi:hypothetical protein
VPWRKVSTSAWADANAGWEMFIGRTARIAGEGHAGARPVEMIGLRSGDPSERRGACLRPCSETSRRPRDANQSRLNGHVQTGPGQRGY